MVELEGVAPHAEQQAGNNIDIWHSAQRGGERETDETILRRLRLAPYRVPAIPRDPAARRGPHLDRDPDVSLQGGAGRCVQARHAVCQRHQIAVVQRHAGRYRTL
ncbi:hypothetical protein G6F40_016443 [Rhizopus arrhizus]|nr:hypothetical protein G6F40_016443 [Rhizopus arrhizus]